jgi:hypothetical protein
MSEVMHDFGAGPVPAHRHPNGGGWVADTASVNKTAYIGPEAEVSGEAWVFGKACVSGEARVYGKVEVFGDARVFGEAEVYGQACVGSVAQIGGPARVTLAPMVLSGGDFHVTISDTHIQVGCHCATADEWETFTPESAPILESMREHILAIARIHQQRAKS